VSELFARMATLRVGHDIAWWTFTLPIPCSLGRRLPTGRLKVDHAAPVQPKGCLPPFLLIHCPALAGRKGRLCHPICLGARCQRVPHEAAQPYAADPSPGNKAQATI
jgi:hypothetical protein